MGNAKGKNKGKGRGKKRSQNLNENEVAKKAENKPEAEAEATIKVKTKRKRKHNCPHKPPTHARTLRCLRLGHVVQCPEHPESFPRRLSECVECNSADRRQVQQERNDRKK
ncbi:hypothetical protein N7517_004666 [Penicillium concentricum]|uniref:Uncharacterized protein n=1 Tax=Penicillium concentricum TaxID=293559 RepID=A0A9W9S791_9EURO|nr:uncharacterized protein N7517_004666 [Penicillium concentricum]KAJ5372660.1 hypothetical protein N7517_004666 [Penicillium concentricum]